MVDLKKVEKFAVESPTTTLLGVTAAWGSQHAITKIALSTNILEESSAAPLLMTIRFAIAGLALSPFFVFEVLLLRQGIELGFLGFAGFALQTAALQTTTATRSAFILYLNVKLVPIILAARGEKVPLFTWLMAALALLGTGVLFSSSLESSGIVIGDILSLFAATFSALFIVRLSDFASPFPLQLSAVSTASTSLLSFIWLFYSIDPLAIESQMHSIAFFFEPTTLIAALYLGFIPSALCTVLQAVAQPKLKEPARAAVLYALDPIFAAAFSHFILGETFGGPIGTFGALLIATAAFAPPIRDLYFLSNK